MMRRFLTACLICLLSIPSLLSQNVRTVEVKPFSELSVFGSFNLELIPGTEESMKLESEDVDLSKISITQEGEFLKIKATKNLFSAQKKVKIYLTYKQLNLIKANGGAHIESVKAVEKQNLKLIARNGSNFLFPLKVENLKAVVGQGASMSLEGSCSNMEVIANNGGLFNAYDLKCAQTKAKARTGGLIKITTSKNLEANVFMNGQISYHGTPKLLVNQIFGGSVERLNE